MEIVLEKKKERKQDDYDRVCFEDLSEEIFDLKP